MNPRETAALLRLLATLDGRLRRAMTDPQLAARTIDEWNEATVHIPAATEDGTWDVMHAVRAFYEQQRGDHTARYFAYEPHHLLAAWADHRGSRMERHTDPIPAADPDDVSAYRAELVGTRQAVATGQAPPSRYRAALDPAGQRRLDALTARIGADVPGSGAPYIRPEVREELRSHVPNTRAGLPALGIDCPVAKCRATERRPCTSPQGRELRRTVHGQRRDAWAVHTAPCPECGAAPRQPCPTAEPHPARIQVTLTSQEGRSAA
ncbi:hypothetical protein [Streptomyces decoyicus]|uniref:zinc finger domain-containing protein n=1 Tax=Streptomyces decoyicus TaxID=249567 RepID=UPI0038691E4E|nr:hypothetical protein OG532_16565 [Streptomyces decoyicus]